MIKIIRGEQPSPTVRYMNDLTETELDVPGQLLIWKHNNGISILQTNGSGFIWGRIFKSVLTVTGQPGPFTFNSRLEAIRYAVNQGSNEVYIITTYEIEQILRRKDSDPSDEVTE